MLFSKQPYYYVPEKSTSSILGTVSLFLLAMGSTFLFNQMPGGLPLLAVGSCLMIAMLWLWFSHVIQEHLAGLNSPRVDLSFRWGMVWFIFSEVMFFMALFGALFYVRLIVLPNLNTSEMHQYFWGWYHVHFSGHWPTVGVREYVTMFSPLTALGLPAINTAILLTSGATLTFSHYALCDGKKNVASFWLFLTVLLGLTFVTSQVFEYHHALTHSGVSLSSGIYGSLFYFLTGFHGLHVTLGCIMLFVIFLRLTKGHLKPENHFSFEAVAWYWHFVDVVWLLLFVFVYWV